MFKHELQWIRLAALIAVWIASTSDSVAQYSTREVIVNGALTNAAELSILDALNCGSPVPNGRYWLNVNTGAWGYQGGPQAGVLGSGCAPAQSQQNQQGDCESKYRVHEDRMCYCYHVC